MLHLVHSLLTRLPPETAHNLGLELLRIMPFKLNVGDEPFKINTRFGTIVNPVGLAAGFDKEGRYVKQLAKLGFGYIVVGTVTKNPRKGMPKPRIARCRERLALVNAMAFPNPGLDQFIKNIKASNIVECPVLASVSDENQDYLLDCYRELQPHVAAIEVNISSPNTPQLRRYFQPNYFKQVAEMLYQYRQKPTYLKIPPYSDQNEFEMINNVVKIWHDMGFDGVTAVNAILVDEPRVTAKRGGLSGKPLFPHMLKCVEYLRKMFDDDFEIHGVGGIFTGEDVFETLSRGARTVQIYTALAYRGVTAVRDMLKELLHIMKSRNIHSLVELEQTARQTQSSSSD